VTVRPNGAGRARAQRHAITRAIVPTCPVSVIVGPPAGGKSTYAENTAGPADAIVDLDRLALAIAPPGTAHHRYPDHLRRAAMAARHAAIVALTTNPATPHVYLIHAHPDPVDLITYRQWSAVFVIVDPGEPEVRYRCERLRPDRAMRAVDRWYRTPPLIPSPYLLIGPPVPLTPHHAP
jgi:hypothetical protein